MPTVLSHPAVPLAIGLGLGRARVPRRLLLAGVAASILPDLDSLTFRVGISYGTPLGHRGLSHSLVFAVAIALIGACACRSLRTGWGRAFVFLCLGTASHGLLDACTTGGFGIAFFWPWSSARYVAPFQIIEVAPMTLARLLSPRGATVLTSELLWVWLPCALVALGLAGLRVAMHRRGAGAAGIGRPGRGRAGSRQPSRLDAVKGESLETQNR